MIERTSHDSKLNSLLEAVFKVSSIIIANDAYDNNNTELIVVVCNDE
jgi:hypothetical protein